MEHDLPEAPAPRLIEPAAQAEVPRISSQQLLAGAKEVLIEHHGTLYRLRQTALGKLILTK
ncbi:MAG: hemin uptake protein HemP [Rhizobacter sp.]|nr:hemin uptake protein HemP [Rhizobacter sp.]